MSRIFSFTLLGASALALVACGLRPNDNAYLNRGGPESLIDVSSEVVTLSSASAKDRADLADWVAKDQPTRAELNCAPKSKACDDTRKVLELSGVPVMTGAGGVDAVTLIYERILARDCEQRYVDNPQNFYNTNHRAFGCATAANMVQQVTDKQEFISPALSDDPRATRAVTDYKRAYAPRDVVKPYSVEESLAAKSKTQQ